MAKNPSSIFYWVDWTSDLALKGCSMAAQGMWMQMLAIAAEAGGYVKIGDEPCSICRLAEITKQDKRSVSKWIRELGRKGVFSRTEDGVIYCRRMRREAEERAAKKAKGGAQVRKKFANSRHPPEVSNQPDLLDNSTPKSGKCTSSSSDSVAVSQDSLPTSEPLPSLDAPRAREGKSENNEKGNPEEGRCAPLGRSGERPQPEDGGAEPIAAKTRMPARLADRHRDGECDEVPSQAPAADNRDLALARQGQHHDASVAGQLATVGLPRRGRPPPRPGKSPALKAKIREQLRAKHDRFLRARRRPEELVAYWTGLLDDDPAVAQRVFDEVDHRMRCAGWDDMREWKHQQGIGA